MDKIIGLVRKSDNAVVRVTTGTWKGRPVVDIRVWYLPASQSEYVASQKGITIDANKLHDLMDVLARASV